MRQLDHGEYWDLRFILERLEDIEFTDHTAAILVTSIELKTLKSILTELLDERKHSYIRDIMVNL